MTKVVLLMKIFKLNLIIQLFDILKVLEQNELMKKLLNIFWD